MRDNYMKQDIENIIKKNLPEIRKHIHGKECENYEECEKFSLFERASENALSQINTSLIADEVLKVVVEEKYRLYKQLFDKINKMPMCIWHEKDELLDIIKISLCTDNKKAE
jgi:hypothetical protein